MAATAMGFFLASAGALAFFYLGGDFRTGRGHGFLRARTSPAVIRKPLDLLDDWRRKRGFEHPTPSLRMTAFRAKAVDPAGPPRPPFSHAGRLRRRYLQLWTACTVSCT